MTAFGFSDRQILMIRDAAAQIPPEQRSRFLESVVQVLLGEIGAHDRIGDCHALPRPSW